MGLGKGWDLNCGLRVDMRIMEKCQPVLVVFCKRRKVVIFDEVN